MNRWTVTLGLVVSLLASSMANADITTFDNGTEGWSVSGRDAISSTGGNPGYCMDVDVYQVFGAHIMNTTNPEFLGDYTQHGAMRMTVDVNVESISYFGMEHDRDLIIELVDVVSEEPYQAVTVWAELGLLTSDNPGWHTYSIDILDPTMEELPDGWNGTGSGDLHLPEGRTFASVLESVDSVRFTTVVPGYFYSHADYLLAVDNVGFMAVPEPTTLSLLGLGAFGLLRRRR